MVRALVPAVTSQRRPEVGEGIEVGQVTTLDTGSVGFPVSPPASPPVSPPLLPPVSSSLLPLLPTSVSPESSPGLLFFGSSSPQPIVSMNSNEKINNNKDEPGTFLIKLRILLPLRGC